MTMRFIYHHRTAGRGAEGNHIASLVRALEAAGHPVTLVSPPGVDPLKTAGGVPLDKGATKPAGIQGLWQWVSCHCPQIVFEMLELGYNLYVLFRLPPVLRRDRSAVYYERYAFFLFAGVLLAKWCGRPVILEVNEVTGIERARGLVMVRLAHWLERKVFARADKIVTVSSFLQQQVLQRGGRQGGVYVLPNAIDPKRFEVNGSGLAIRRQLALDGSTVVGFVGWFDRWDRLELLVEAVRDLRQTHPELRLLLVGDGPVTRELGAKIQREQLADATILTGPIPRDEVPAYIDAMDICVLPDSNPFGSPLVLFEFMAMAKAVIAPDLPPIRDVVADGERGVIIPRGDVRLLREAIRTLTEDAPMRVRLGQQARRQVMERHTWEANARCVVELAKEVTPGSYREER